MAAKQIDVTCPCCSSRLTVDVLTRSILRTVRAEELDASGHAALDPGRWDVAAERVKGRDKSSRDKLEQALDRERGKEQHLDDLFRKAQEKLSKPDPDDR